MASRRLSHRRYGTMVEESTLKPKKYLWWCSVLHIINDGYISSLSILLPFIAVDLNLTYAQSGFLKTASHGAISATQIPAGIFAERIGDILILGIGTTWFSLSYMGLILAFSYPLALMLIFSSGVGGGVYHPVGTALVSNVYPPEKAGPAISTLNFFGDVGKVLFPALAGILVIRVGWGASCAVLGTIGLAASVLYLFFFRADIGVKRHSPTPKIETQKGSRTKWMTFQGWGIAQPTQFTLYSIIGLLDNGIRAAVTTFLAFLIKIRVDANAVGGLMSLTFFGGALGKLLCGMPIQKLGIKKIILLTELLMILGCFALPSVPSGWVIVLFLPLFGFMLNGTSSVIYVGTAPTLNAEFRSRGYALHYTLSFIASATAPYLAGFVGDTYNLKVIFYASGAVMLFALPLVMFLKDSIHSSEASH
ncbi:MFS transporter [Candidatus Poribacteria bacterium]|nr:MFS transporter [Candidatus Poribacteria bacterium]